MSELLDAALDYAGRGWPVFPLWWPLDEHTCACGGAHERSDAGNIGKHPLGELAPKGLHDATTDAEVVRRWWTKRPHANIGLRTGVVFDVLDVDGDDGLAALAAHGPLDGGDDYPQGWDGPEVVTGRGFHRYLLPTGAHNRQAFVPHCDWRGAGGYVIGPPSLHKSGVRYAWGPGGPDVPLEVVPRWLLELVKPTPAVRSLPAATGLPAGRGGTSTAGLVGVVAAAPEGERNGRLFWAAAKVRDDLMAGRLAASEAETAWFELHVVAVRAGLDEREVERTIRSAMKGRAA